MGPIRAASGVLGHIFSIDTVPAICTAVILNRGFPTLSPWPPDPPVKKKKKQRRGAHFALSGLLSNLSAHFSPSGILGCSILKSATGIIIYLEPGTFHSFPACTNRAWRPSTARPRNENALPGGHSSPGIIPKDSGVRRF